MLIIYSNMFSRNISCAIVGSSTRDDAKLQLGIGESDAHLLNPHGKPVCRNPQKHGLRKRGCTEQCLTFSKVPILADSIHAEFC